MGWTQSEFAAKGGVSKASQVAYESDATVPNLDYLMGIARAGCDLIYVLTGSRTKVWAADQMDWSLHAQIGAEVDRLQRAEKIQLSEEKRTAMIHFLYRQLFVAGKYDADVIRSVIRLAAI